MRKRLLLILMLAGITASYVNGQNAAESLLDSESKLSIGGYAQIDYNQPLSSDVHQNGKMDIHRLVMLFAYRFNDRTQFVTEVEYEHVKEVYVEQAFLNYRINPWLNFRGGLLLIPMGIINEYHEPATYNGVERPNLDSKIVPSTWREIGAGFTGNVQNLNLKYQLYVVNGFKSYDDGGILRGSDAFRKGRQKGAESILTHPNLSAKIDYYGVPGLKLGLSGYFGETQTSLYDGIAKDDSALEAKADSSVVGMNMVGLDGRYSIDGWVFRGQLNYASLSNTNQYNAFTGKDVGSELFGYYLEAGYDLLNGQKTEQKLVPFVRYEKYNTHKAVDGIEKNLAYDRTDITAGIGWWLAQGAVLKADMQWFGNEATDDFETQLNLGIGIWF
ncbi:hypothetical protein [Sunxiuqinia elliptica]|uniref:Phosphate-selective porin O and P n=1 Tax=Sunxiuqinia elliptica TaxID=655355 RepID=A0A4V3BXT6_9BACT|nr:hypothetical protein [Sunxiuqinia elliptica]TDN99998.1 hypothetical protein DET52_106211 [Sunxiuqinia elliptica]TDO57190.1 hypothetical protein DET65_3775 [Sunxiuqinia elliptica]